MSTKVFKLISCIAAKWLKCQFGKVLFGWTPWFKIIFRCSKEKLLLPFLGPEPFFQLQSVSWDHVTGRGDHVTNQV